MAFVQRVQVMNGKPVTVQVAGAEHGLPEDRNWDNTAQAYQGSNVLYDASNPAAEPSAAFLAPQGDIYSTNIVTEIEVHGITPEYQGKTCFVYLSDEDTYVERNLNTRYTMFNMTESVAVTGPIAVFKFITWPSTPSGLFGKYTVNLRVDDGTNKTDVSIGTIPLEVYYLSVPDLPGYFQDKATGNYKVPLLLLRMFVLPMRYQDNSQTVGAWISLVVNIVFGSQTPLDGKKSQTENHWLKYNSVSGSSRFADQYGDTGLNLQAWLDAYRNWTTYGVTTSINCYDQAAITEVALCLGLPHQQINWEFHQVYGFIDADLVGWGSCNSPYFGNDLSKIRYTNPQDPERQGFRNHAYLSWSNKPMPSKTVCDAYNEQQRAATTHDQYMANALAFEQANGLQLLMIDSCAGPHVGTESRQTYEQGITLIPDPKSSFCTYIKTNSTDYPSRWATNHNLGKGISSYSTSKLGNLLPDSKQGEFNTVVASIKAMLPPTSQSVVSETQISAIQDVFYQFLDTLKSNWTRSNKVPVRPYTTSDGTTVHECNLYYTASKETDATLHSAMSMRVALNSNPGAIQQALASQLALATFTSRNWRVIERSKITAAGQTLSVVGSFYIRAFQIGNIAVEVNMDEDYAWPDDSPLMQNLLNTVVEVLQDNP